MRNAKCTHHIFPRQRSHQVLIDLRNIIGRAVSRFDLALLPIGGARFWWRSTQQEQDSRERTSGTR